jgi:hypothetical protein
MSAARATAASVHQTTFCATECSLPHSMNKDLRL